VLVRIERTALAARPCGVPLGDCNGNHSLLRSRRVLTFTEEKAAFEVRPLNFRKGQRMSAGYLKLNPRQKVPLHQQ